MAKGVSVILDSCALLWLAEGGRRLSNSCRKRVEAASELWVPAVSGFEIAQKYYRGKLSLPASPDEWIPAVIKRYGLAELHLDMRTGLLAAALPPIHDDPIDRLIIAAAKLRNMEVVTSDARFPEYGIKTLC